MNAGTPKFTKWLVALFLVALFAAGSCFFIQYKVQTETRAALESLASQNDLTLTLKDVRYNLFSNVLTIDGIDVKTNSEENSTTYKASEIVVTNPDRPLVLAFVQGKFDDAVGIQPVADSVDVRNFSTGPIAVMTTALQRIEGITVDMDIFREYLKKTDPSQIETMIMMAEALAYKSRVVNGITATSSEGGITVNLSVASAVETDYANLTSASTVATDTVIKFNDGTNDSAFTLKKVSFERMSITKEFLTKSLLLDLNSPDSEIEAIQLLKSLFMNERPFIGTVSFEDMLLVTPQLNIPVKSFHFQNTSTKPFAVRVDLSGLTLPSALVFSGIAEQLVSDLPNLTYNASVDGIFPYENPKGLTKISVEGGIDKLGNLDIQIDGLANYSLADAEAISDDFRLASMNFNYTDAGLAPRAARISQALFGVDISKLGPLALELIWNMVPEDQRTPHNRTMVEQFMNFMQKPGAISFTFTPPAPLTSAELEELVLTPDMLKVTVTAGPKTLNELVEALPKQ